MQVSSCEEFHKTVSEFDSHDHFDFDSDSHLDFIFVFHSDWDSIFVLNMILMWILIQIVTLICILVFVSVQPSSLAQIKMKRMMEVSLCHAGELM